MQRKRKPHGQKVGILKCSVSGCEEEFYIYYPRSYPGKPSKRGKRFCRYCM